MKTQLENKAIELLRQASFLDEKRFMCFGRYFFQLHKLELIDDEYNVTYLGRQFIKYCAKQDKL